MIMNDSHPPSNASSLEQASLGSKSAVAAGPCVVIRAKMQNERRKRATWLCSISRSPGELRGSQRPSGTAGLFEWDCVHQSAFAPEPIEAAAQLQGTGCSDVSLKQLTVVPTSLDRRYHPTVVEAQSRTEFSGSPEEALNRRRLTVWRHVLGIGGNPSSSASIRTRAHTPQIRFRRIAIKNIDFARLQRGEPILSGQGHKPDFGGISQHGGRQGAVDYPSR